MSKVLMIRHLPTTLTLDEKKQLLKHFGAENVWESIKKRNYVFASFPSIQHAQLSLSRLHQLEIAHRRLVVEYTQESVPVTCQKTSNEQSTVITQHIKRYLQNLNALSPSVNFYQPPSPHLKYKYPEPTTTTLVNIIYSLIQHKPFYTQTVHLMNKMSLNSPFQDNENALQMFKNMFRNLFLDEFAIPVPVSEPESEISSDELNINEQNKKIPIIVKRKHTLPKTRKRAATVLSTAAIKTTTKKQKQEEVFDEATIEEPKKISVNVSQDVLEKQTASDADVVGTIGKYQKEEESQDDTQQLNVEPDKPTITKKELLQNRISYSDMKILSVFKNYHPGPPSMRLYIKNLAKTVTDQDIKRIYRRYIDESEKDATGFDVRVMQEGRMKGQGFVTFPSVSTAEVALNETNGYILKDKPMVVQFARVANKKPIQ